MSGIASSSSSSSSSSSISTTTTTTTIIGSGIANPNVGRIKRLDEATVCRIAAGEVIQKPANAVKEMLENSLDAKSTTISVTVKNGGLKFLQIVDNGKGISKDDFPLLCERFATSKLTTFEELQEGKVSTFGFRGEALASISHVSHLKVISMTAESQCAFRASFEDGKIVGSGNDTIVACAGVKGTTITVEDLFYNIPLRQKAMRNAADEYSRIVEVVARYALHNSSVAFSCKRKGENTAEVHTTIGATIEENLRVLFGHATAREIVKVSITAETAISENIGLIACNAWITNANYNQRKGVFILFINNRLVDCSPLKRAIDAAYSKYLPKGGHAFVYLALKIKPENVDVNVHPTKSEVRFLHESEIVETIQKAITTKLAENNESRTFAAAKSLPLASQQVINATASPLTNNNSTSTTIEEFDDFNDISDSALIAATQKQAQATQKQHQNQNSDNPSLSPPLDDIPIDVNSINSAQQPNQTIKNPSPTSPRPMEMSPMKKMVVIVNQPSPGTYYQQPNLDGNQQQQQQQQPSPGRPTQQSRMIRHDPTAQTLDLFITNPPQQNKNKTTTTTPAKEKEKGDEKQREKRTEPDIDDEDENLGITTNDYSENSCNAAQTTNGGGATTSVPLPRRRPKGFKACALTSVAKIISGIESKSHLGLEEALTGCSFVGFADSTFALVQHTTKLYACNILTLCQELFFQQTFLRFNNFGRINLRPNISLRELLNAAKESPALSSQQGTPPTDTDWCIKKISTMKEMLSEYFCVEITKDNALASLPQIIDGYVPNMAYLPIFIYGLATRVNWQQELDCFEDIAHQLAEFYVPHPPIDESPSETTTTMKAYQSTIQNILFPAVKTLLYPRRVFTSDGTFVQIASMENLYKSFERC